MRIPIGLLAILFFTASRGLSQPPEDQPLGPALTPEASLRQFHVADGLCWNLLLSEPTISQPLSTAFDTAGRLWVVQYLQYPEPAGLKVLSRDNFWRIVYDRAPKPPGEDIPGADKITIFEGRNRNGELELVGDFVNGLNIATSVVPVYRGAWVLNPPYLLFYSDQDEDLKADGPPEVHLEGFGLEDTHSVANSLCMGPDGWLYGAQGSTVSGSIRPYQSDQPPLRTMGQLIWRYHPQLRRYEVFAEGGGNAFGVAFDDRGHLFSGHNGGDTRGFHYIQGGYYRKGFSKHGDLSNPFAFGYIEQMEHEPVQRFSHTLLALEGTALEKRCPSSFLAVDPLHSKLFHTRREQVGSTYRTNDVEALIRSDDKWFRPVAVSDGPDGAAYICDWYDSQVAHIYAHVGKYDREHGRVYRLAPCEPIASEEAWNPAWAQASDSATLDALVQKLRSPMRWQRWRARELIARHPLKSLARDRLLAMANENSSTAVDALWTLHLCGWIQDCLTSSTEANIPPERFFDSPVAAVREWAVRLACDDGELNSETAQRLRKRARIEDDPMVLVQLACSMRRLPARQAVYCARGLLERALDPGDRHLYLACWWLFEQHADDHAEMRSLMAEQSLFYNAFCREKLVPNLIQRWCMQGTRDSYQSAAYLFERISELPEDLKQSVSKESIQSFEKAFEGRSLNGVKDELLQAVSLLGEPSLALRLRRGDADASHEAIEILRSSHGMAETRVQLITILRELPQPDAGPVLAFVTLNSEESEPVRIAAAAALRSYEDSNIDWQLLGDWPNLSVPLRNMVANVLASKSTRADRLLSALESSEIPEADVPIEAIRALRLLDDVSLQERVNRLFPQSPGLNFSEATALVQQYAEIIQSGAGDPYQGKRLFSEHCGRCHRLFDRGEFIGPELTGYQREQLATLLLNTVAPSLEIREGYQGYAALTMEGTLIAGFIESQDDRQVILRGVDGQSHVLAREALAEIRPMPQSIMPDGLLDRLTEQQLRDLFAYLRSSQPLADGG